MSLTIASGSWLISLTVETLGTSNPAPEMSRAESFSTTAAYQWRPQVRLRRSDLCTECANIDLAFVFTRPFWFLHENRGRMVLLHQDIPSYQHTLNNSSGVDTPVHSPDCHLCRVLADLRQPTSPTEDGSWKLVLDDFQADIEELSNIRDDSYRRRWVTLRLHSESSDRISGRLLCRMENVGSIGLNMNEPRILPKVFNVDLAKVWLAHCQVHHPGCSTIYQVPQTSFVDCVERRVVKFAEGSATRFIALSYVWGKTSDQQQQHLQQIPPDFFSSSLGSSETLPRTIVDAMAITEALGFRYLWVDQYCIDQTDPDDRARQIHQMDLIYMCADLTIIAAAGDNHNYGLPGVGQRLREELLEPFVLDDQFTFGAYDPQSLDSHLKGSVWNARAWTFQEAQLSRRRLIFTENGTMFGCGRNGCVQEDKYGSVECANGECASRLIFSFNSFRLHGMAYKLLSGDREAGNKGHGDQATGFYENFNAYTRLVMDYATRNLSFPADGLYAFRGVANAFENAMYPVYNAAGIPFIVGDELRTAALLTERSFSKGLAWSLSCDENPQNQPRPKRMACHKLFPSWSWANMLPIQILLMSWSTCNRRLVHTFCHYAQDIRLELTGNSCDTDEKGHMDLESYAHACRVTASLNSLEPRAVHLTATIFLPIVIQSEDTDTPAGKFSGYGGFSLDRERKHCRVRLWENKGLFQIYIDESALGSQTWGTSATKHAWIHNKLVSGQWSLVLLGHNFLSAKKFELDLHMLCVEWKDERTAIRVGTLRLRLSLHWTAERTALKLSLVQKYPGNFAQRRVRLV